jgi:geranylgeranyl diphosphate synthase type I
MDISAITSHKKSIDEKLIYFLAKKQEESINELQRDLIDRLVPFVTSGKSIRGALAVFGYSLFQKQDTQKILDLAIALELLHSGLLIHDDIMDRDELRRGKLSIYAQYEEYGKQNITTDSRHFGVSMGINAADFCFFSGYELLGRLGGDITEYVSAELTHVTAAQMLDVAASQTAQRLSEEDILSVYRYKTARYTFSLPLVAGAKLAGAPQEQLAILDSLGEDMGIMFQIRDDELNLLGDPQKTGKSTGSDVREHKQTLLSLYLTNATQGVSLASLSSEEIAKLYIDSGTQKHIADKISSLAALVNAKLQSLAISNEHTNTLMALVDFVQTREN